VKPFFKVMVEGGIKRASTLPVEGNVFWKLGGLGVGETTVVERREKI